MTDYKNTLNLPQTKFAMKANLPVREPETARFWKESGIYEKILSARPAPKRYLLHDGPPYANGHIHIGHALNKILKDIVIKHKTMCGFNCPYVPGWDCHGLPVEHQLFKDLKMNKAQIPQVEFRKKAHDYAMKFVDIQRDEFKRLGVLGDWDNPYLTLKREYEYAIIKSFARLTEAGYIYKGLKPVNFCCRCETALAEAEVEYEDHASPSVYVKFRIKDKDNTYILIWTTTPWTLIANVAVCVHPDYDYAIVNTGREKIILAKGLLEPVMQKACISDYKIEAVVKGSQLEGILYSHPFGLREGRVVLGDYVSLEEGTGCVHTAPGHGQEDYETGIKYKLPVIMPVDDKGRFEKGSCEFEGMNVIEANPAISARLKESGLLLYEDRISHSYPHCWRCKNPIIFRATEQWFMSIDHRGLRKSLTDEIEKVEWIPGQGKERISAMIALRPDWCLSRQRYWGVPIPVILCRSCKAWIADHKVMEHFAEIVKKAGSNAWFELDIKDILPSGYKCAKCSGSDFKKGEDILDVWFESGVSHQAVLKENKDLSYPADIYLEGSDQHRGWFQAALITAMGIDNRAPFKSVLTHGFVVDGEGRKMSKSLGNVISPQDVIKEYGADILRLWVASSDYNDDIRISPDILARLTEAYRKIRNTARFLLANLYDFNPAADKVDYEKMLEVDKWAVSRAHTLLRDVMGYYDSFQFHKVYHTVYGFCVTEMSNFYLDILKDRLYTFSPKSIQRRSCQSALYEIANAMVRAIAPILVFTSEEIWQNMPKDKDSSQSVHLSLWPGENDIKIDKALEARWQDIIDIRSFVLKTLEASRTSGIIGSSLEAMVTIFTEQDNIFSFLKEYEGVLAEVFIVSQVELKKSKPQQPSATYDETHAVYVSASKAKGEKCPRCWNYASITENGGVCKRCNDALSNISGR